MQFAAGNAVACRECSPSCGRSRTRCGSRTLTSSGETSDCTKLNWPIGQTYLQNDAAAKQAVDREGRDEIADAIQAVHHGLSQRANAS